MVARHRLQVLAGIIAGFSVFPAYGQAAQPPARLQVAQAERVYDFNLAAQPLDTALTAFSRTTGLQTVTTGILLQGRQGAAVQGSLTAREALRRLLAGTGITYRLVDGNTVTLIEAPQGSGGAAVLDALTVSGEKTERSLQDTATSVAVFDTRSLDERPYMATTNSVFGRVANVTGAESNNFAPTVRGVDGTGPTNGGYAFVAGIRPRLNLLIDGRPASFNELVYGDASLWDVEQVEVLRGPQSTIQGRNAIAGAMVVKTKDPTWDWQGGGRVLGGSYDLFQTAAYVSGPLVADQLAMRLAVDRKTGESYVSGARSYASVSNPNEFESETIRGKLLFEPKKLDGFSTLLTFNYNRTLQPQGEQVRWPEAGLTSAYPTNMSTFEPRTTSGIADTTWILNDALTLENSFSYTDLGIIRRAPPGDGYVSIKGYELLEEPRLRFTGMDGRLKGLGGLHAFHASQDELFNFAFFGGDNYFKDLTTTYAAFGEATYSLLSDVDATLGGRLERENRRRLLLSGGLPRVNFDETYEVFLPKAGLAWHLRKEWTVGTTVSRGYNGGGAGTTFVGGTLYQFSPEYVWNYEAYTRMDLLEGRLNLTGNVFYADYKNMQLPFNPGGAGEDVVRNAPKAHTIGAEVGARWLATPNLSIFGNIGLLKTEIDEFGVYSGNDLANAPALTVDAGFNYKFAGGFDAGADLRYSEAYYSSIDNAPRGKVDPYVVANTQAGYQIAPSARIFAFVNNVFDTRAELRIYNDNSADINRPRTFGLGLDVKF